jgi:hypothetical protein
VGGVETGILWSGCSSKLSCSVASISKLSLFLFQMSLEDEDVVLAGSALHTHLVTSGYNDLELRGGDAEQLTVSDNDAQANETDVSDRNDKRILPLHWFKVFGKMKPVMTFISPGGISKELENEFAKIILESCLLVVEDEEFFLRFILADSTSFPHRSDSVLLDSLLFSSSLAAGAIFMKKVSLGAAALPLIFTTVFGLRTGTQLIERRQAYKLKSTLCCLISSMKQVKTMLSKSLNLIRGMEMISKGCLVAVKSGQLESGSSTLEESKLSKAQYNRTLLIPLRQSVYSESLRMILALRQVQAW